MAKQLDRISISKSVNGGHTVTHEFKRHAVNRKGAMSGGMMSDQPPSEEHSFGAGEAQQNAVLAHIAKALGFSKAAKEESTEDA